MKSVVYFWFFRSKLLPAATQWHNKRILAIFDFLHLIVKMFLRLPLKSFFKSEKYNCHSCFPSLIGSWLSVHLGGDKLLLHGLTCLDYHLWRSKWGGGQGIVSSDPQVFHRVAMSSRRKDASWTVFCISGETLPFPSGDLVQEVIILLLLTAVEYFRQHLGKTLFFILGIFKYSNEVDKVVLEVQIYSLLTLNHGLSLNAALYIKINWIMILVGFEYFLHIPNENLTNWKYSYSWQLIKLIETNPVPATGCCPTRLTLIEVIVFKLYAEIKNGSKSSILYKEKYFYFCKRCDKFKWRVMFCSWSSPCEQDQKTQVGDARKALKYIRVS